MSRAILAALRRAVAEARHGEHCAIRPPRRQACDCWMAEAITALAAVGRVSLGYTVLCRADRKPDGSKGRYEVARSEPFETLDAAVTYARGISESREPRIVEDVLHLWAIPGPLGPGLGTLETSEGPPWSRAT
ncbi:MAG TPA: hypothetical protein VIW28_00520 [Gemmatimonadales bacterium]|jgi:hypothetical protein